MRIKQFDSGDKSFFEDCSKMIMSSAAEFIADGKEKGKIELICEEILVSLRDNALEDKKVTVKNIDPVEVFEACSELFLTVTTLISKLIPAVVFAAVFLLIIQTGTDSLMAMVSMTGTEVAAMICSGLFQTLRETLP